MVKFYHVSPIENLPSIMKHGLIPKFDPKKLVKGKVVFLWGDFQVAKGVAEVMGYATIFEVDLPKNTVIKGRWNSEYYFNQKIPVDKIKIRKLCVKGAEGVS